MKTRVVKAVCVVVLVCLGAAPALLAQRRNFYLPVELPKKMDVNAALQVLGLPVKNIDALAKLTDEQKTKIIAVAVELQDKLLEKMVAQLEGDAKKLLANYKAGGREFGSELGFLDLTDDQKEQLRKAMADYGKAVAGAGAYGRGSYTARRKWSDDVQKIVTEQQLQVLIKVRTAKSRTVGRGDWGGHRRR